MSRLDVYKYGSADVPMRCGEVSPAPALCCWLQVVVK